MKPDPYTTLNAAVALQNRGDFAGAQALYWQILLDDPAQFDALHLLGVSKCQQGQQAEGSWFIARALDQRPDDAGAHFNLAMALAELHRPTEAIARFDQALALKPDHAPSWFSRGDALQGETRYAEAIESYQRALALQPGMAGALANMGMALLASGRTTDAIGIFADALAKGADRCTALVNTGRALQELGRTAEACDSFAAASATSPDAAQPRWLWAMATIPELPGGVAEVTASRPAFAAAIDSLDAWYRAAPGRDRLELSWPFYLAYQAQSNRDLLQKFGALRARLMAPFQPALRASPRAQGPIRVGIVSSQISSHSVWHAITRGWFAHFDPDQIALHGFHLGRKSDDETAFARAHSASFTYGERRFPDWVRAIQAAQPDVLIYPAIGMDNMSANLASLRLAPVQMASWGHPETTGLPTIDYYISAEAFEPPNADAAYTEKLIRLPRLGVAFLPQAATPRPPDLGSLGIDPTRPIILCPGAPFKYAPEKDHLLAAIARHGQLIFFHTKSNSPLSHRLEQRLTARFAAEGLDFAAHAKFIPFQNMESFYGLLARADLCLDTIGFSGFNTAMQALGQCVPLVGYEGAFMRGRLASGTLRQMGLDELVATSDAGFIAIATQLARDAPYRASIRARIVAETPRLYDDKDAVKALQEEIKKKVFFV